MTNPKQSKNQYRLLEEFVSSNEPKAFYFFKDKLNKQPKGYLFKSYMHSYAAQGLFQPDIFFNQLQHASGQGYHLAGYLNYETGYLFEDKFQKLKKANHASVWFGAFQKCIALSNQTVLNWLNLRNRQSNQWPDFWLSPAQLGMTQAQYERQLVRIQRFIAQGDTYQVNFTFPMTMRIWGNLMSLFTSVLKHQPVGYAAYIEHDNKAILSFSPELFFEKKDLHIMTKPMKGTAKRTKDAEQNKEIRSSLFRSEKNRAENVMIVDLLRNDLGRLCRSGSIKVTALFDIETYKTIYQMTSTIQGKLEKKYHWYTLFKNIFPCGSITGAPKIRTMEIIHQLEKKQRGLYTGALGFIKANDQAHFNVPIRTLEVDTDNHLATMGVGSGIVADSKASLEWQESLDKAVFITNQMKNYELLETLLWEPGIGYHNVAYHIKRLQKSARFFKIPFKAKAIINKLQRFEKSFSGLQKKRVRLLVDYQGTCRLEWHRINNMKVSKKTPYIILSRKQVHSGNLFLYHKTTNRDFYNQEFLDAQKEGCVDIIFRNEHHFITEGAISNVYIKKDGIWSTPPIKDGVLPGVTRDILLQGKEPIIRERSLTFNDLKKADAIYLSNAIKGLYEVQLK